MADTAPTGRFRRLTPAQTERAVEIAAGRLQPSASKDAATVVLVRDAPVARADGTGRLEVFLLRRVSTMAFAAGMHVFPGGKVESDDRYDGALPAGWSDVLSGGDEALLSRIVGAAVRETVEETGVRLTAGDLRPFAHWITPSVELLRYDTRFLIAPLPAGQSATSASGEADLGFWTAPHEAQTLRIMAPTRAALLDLAGCADVAAAVTKQRVIRPVQPRIEQDADGWRFVIDGVA